MFFEYFPLVLLWEGSLLIFARAKARMKWGLPGPQLVLLLSAPSVLFLTAEGLYLARR